MDGERMGLCGRGGAVRACRPVQRREGEVCIEKIKSKTVSESEFKRNGAKPTTGRAALRYRLCESMCA